MGSPTEIQMSNMSWRLPASLSFDRDSIETAHSSRTPSLSPSKSSILSGYSIEEVSSKSEKQILESVKQKLMADFSDKALAEWALPVKTQGKSETELLKEARQTLEAKVAINKLDSSAAPMTRKRKQELLTTDTTSLSVLPVKKVCYRSAITSAAKARGLQEGLDNTSGVDCFRNSSLHLLRSLGVQVSPGKQRDLPLLHRFLQGENLNVAESAQLHKEIYDHFLQGTAEFKGGFNTHTGRSTRQQDASAFLVRLLDRGRSLDFQGEPYLISPRINTQQVLSNPTDPNRRTMALPSESVIPLAIPESTGPAPSVTMEQIVANSFRSHVPCNWHGDGENVDVTREVHLSDPTPDSLAVSLNRFINGPNGQLEKKFDEIEDVFNPITLPAADGKKIAYEPTSIICHSGLTMKGGHYLCYRKIGNNWILFNDKAEVRPMNRDDLEFIRTNCYVISYDRAH